MHIFKIFDKIKSTSSRNDKRDLLKQCIADDDMYALYILSVAFDPTYITHLNKLEYTPGEYTSVSYEDFVSISKLLLENNITDVIRNEVRTFLGKCCEYDAKYYYEVLTKTLRIGLDIKTINEAFGYEYIPVFDVMLAGKDLDKLKPFPCLVELKLDGVRCLIINKGDSCIAFSRNGKEIPLPYHTKYIKTNMNLGVYDGELLLKTDRLNTSSLCNRLIKKPEKVNPEDTKSLIFNCFDYFPLEVWNKQLISDKQSVRTEYLTKYLDNLNTELIAKVPYTICNSLEEVQELYNQYRLNGNEGVIIKNLEGRYEFKRSNNWIKMKAINSATLRCIDVFEGEGKYKGKIGKLLCRTLDGLTVEVGSGLTDADRDQSFSYFTNKLIEIEYNEIQTDKNGKRFFFLPIYKYIREDKELEDTLTDILKEMK